MDSIVNFAEIYPLRPDWPAIRNQGRCHWSRNFNDLFTYRSLADIYENDSVVKNDLIVIKMHIARVQLS